MPNDKLNILQSIAREAMESVWQQTPRPFQTDIISHVLQMRCDPNSPQACLIVQSTGSGKSSVYQTIGVVDGGVVLVLEITLSLGADQATKIRTALSSYGSVNAYQLNSFKSKESQLELTNYMKSIPVDTNSTVFLFASLEQILKAQWQPLLNHIIDKKVLRLICIDEVHQFVHFGIIFRHTFCMLRDKFFNKIINQNHLGNSTEYIPSILTIPVLAMTATFNC